VHALEIVVGVRHHHCDDIMFPTVASTFLQHWNQTKKVVPIFMDLVEYHQRWGAGAVRLLCTDRANDTGTNTVGQCLLDVRLKSV
jgi:predicted NAD-dependent protein-ADP-ribosyltransferase YbiA (DUF1768 family)